MASWKILVALAIFALAFPSTLAKQWTVGDSAGWTKVSVNYTEWAAGKSFFVGDTLGTLTRCTFVCLFFMDPLTILWCKQLGVILVDFRLFFAENKFGIRYA